MIRLMLISIFFALSLLTVFPAPTNMIWYVSILVTEFSWIFFLLVVLLLLSCLWGGKYKSICLLTGIGSLVFFALPVIGAYRIASTLARVFNDDHRSELLHSSSTPFRFTRMVTGVNSKPVVFRTILYDTANGLSLDFYDGTGNSQKPCVIVVHGGSWAAGDSRQLPELNTELANAGYAVAAINYRLAPLYKYPAPVEDLKKAMNYLRSHAGALSLDAARFALLGRSAGGQIVLSAAYTQNDPTIKGVINFYGPADMVWGYANPTNPLVLDSRKVMEDYLGGTYNQVPHQYIKSSATETATPHAVPALLIHGENDPLVSHHHGVRLGARLDSMRVKHYDLYLPWATHAFDWTLCGPGGQISTWSVLRFLELIF